MLVVYMPRKSKKQFSKSSRKNKRKTVQQKQKRKQKRKQKQTKRTNRNIKRKQTLPILYGHIFSDQCIHCINMQSAWDRLVNEVKNIELRDINDNYEYNVQNINKEYNCNLAFEGFPTIFKLKKGGPIEYFAQERTYDNMLTWLYSK